MGPAQVVRPLEIRIDIQTICRLVGAGDAGDIESRDIVDALRGDTLNSKLADDVASHQLGVVEIIIARVAEARFVQQGRTERVGPGGHAGAGVPVPDCDAQRRDEIQTGRGGHVTI